jgi:3-oxoacyl-[acyl-carrier-protein] synthase-3
VNFADSEAQQTAILLIEVVRQVQRELGWTGAGPAGIHDRLADLLDSMGMVEFLLQAADVCGTTPAEIERAVGHEFSTVWALALAMHKAGMKVAQNGAPPAGSAMESATEPQAPSRAVAAGTQDMDLWLAGTAVRLPARHQPAGEINAALHRASGWLESHAGIYNRRLWGEEDPLAAAAAAGRDCLARTGLQAADITALLVASEAPPRLLGLAAALHQDIGLSGNTPALEIGGACTGFLATLWLARSLVSSGPVLVLCLEAPSHFLKTEPGPAGEAAALFGDGAVAAILCHRPAGSEAVPVIDIVLGTDGTGANLLEIQRSTTSLSLTMQGQVLAARAVRVMADNSRALLEKHGVTLADIQAIVAHGGNGRMPALLARKLSIPAERVWSETSHLGNLGAATLPAAWAAHGPLPGLVLWTAVGAGLTWATALTGTWRRS